MTPEQKQAHFRMLATLPVRTHAKKPYRPVEGIEVEEIPEEGGWKRAVTINGKRYASIASAARSLGITGGQLRYNLGIKK